MPELVCWNSQYLSKILTWKNISFEIIGSLYRLPDYKSHSQLIDINSIFSTDPRFEPIDRTLQTVSPWQIHIPRPWKIPTQQCTLAQAMELRVLQLSSYNKKINIFWSGGIDSTTAVNACLQHLPNLSQLRILYSPYSTYEHPGYIDFLKKFPLVELVDISGEQYLVDEFDGIFVTGDGGDELNASLDETFFEQCGYELLHTSWQDFFYKKHKDSKFIDFCQQHFLLAGRPIQTVLEARWWFYATCKQRSILNLRLPWFFNYKKFDVSDLVGFFDCDQYENYIYWNIDQIINRDGYHTWKQQLKDYCFLFDGMQNWHKNKTKTHSTQMGMYLSKKTALNDHRWVAILSDYTKIATPSLPMLTRIEFETAYGKTLDWIFCEPDTI